MIPGPGANAMAPSTLTQQQIADLYFIEHRAKLLDLAAFMDRAERGGAGGRGEDIRLATFRRAIALLTDGKPDRAKRILELMSDPTTDPIPAAPTKGAIGVWPGHTPGGRA